VLKSLVIGLSLLIIAAGCYVLADWWIALPAGRTASYVGRNTCAECHQPEFKAWTGSHHDEAMQEATPQTVLGNFKDQTLEHFGVVTKMFERDGKYWVSTQNADGKSEDYPIKYTFGVVPLQQYLVEFPGGRLQVLPVCWDTDKNRWFHLHPDEPIAPGDALHWTSWPQTWNHMCAECHSTNLQRNYDPTTNSYKTTYSEIDVSCEACHGPGSIHVELAKKNSLFWDRRYGKGLQVNLKDTNNRTQIDTCGQCHSRSAMIAAGMEPGKPLADHKFVHLLDGNLYHHDGQIQDEVFEHGSFLQSKMFRKNIKCTDCHDPHTAKLKNTGNQTCTSCHAHSPGKYDTPLHHHHPVGSSGALCVNCHMPQQTYMVVHARRDHSLRIPRPDLTVKIGTPNACNQCHDSLPKPDLKDKSPEQRALIMAAKVVEWYGPKRSDEVHYGETFQAARQNKPSALPQLLKLVKSNDAGPNVRATAAQLLGNYLQTKSTVSVIDAIVAASKDSDPMVRAAAVSVMPLAELLKQGERLLQDPIRDVRNRTITLFNSIPANEWPANLTTLIAAANKDYEAGQRASLDTPEANSNLGMLAYNRKEYAKAADFFSQALRIFPLAPDAANLLAAALSSQQSPAKKAEAEQVLREALKRHQENLENLREGLQLINDKTARQRREQDIKLTERNVASLELDLALLLAEKPEQYAAAITLLESALQHHPEHPRVAFNLGTLLLTEKKYQEAEQQFRDAVKLEPRGVDVYLSLAETLKLQQKFVEAEALLNEVLNDHPQVDFVLYLAQLYAEEKRWDSAEQLLEYSRQKRWINDPRILGALRQIYAAQGKTDQAQAIGQQLRNLVPRQ
jgi:tetratricopeptide (TPR) repeat protein/Zn finger protein HypA/HybF involved in hydrogenase expression